jgi:hypothetical protein
VGDRQRKDEAQRGEIWIPSGNHNQARESGWAIENLIIEYLQRFPAETAGGQPCALILDIYPTHQTGGVLAATEECDVELLFVPAGGTSEYQPLDYRIFRELKPQAKTEITRLMAICGAVSVCCD